MTFEKEDSLELSSASEEGTKSSRPEGEKNETDKSSETTRKISKTDFDFSSISTKEMRNLLIKDAQKRQHFLEWFVGFFEAEGCFLLWTKKKDGKAYVGAEITQKDKTVLEEIQKVLKIGSLNSFRREKYGEYSRIVINKNEDLKQLIAIVNGNLVSEKRQKLFKNWLSVFNELKSTTFLFKDRTPKITLDDAWMSGFLEGDGGFSVERNFVKQKKNGTKSYSLRMKFFVTQKDGYDFLPKIGQLFKIDTVRTQINRIKNPKTGLIEERFYARLETSSKASHNIVIWYLTKFPFLGVRKFVIYSWQELLLLRLIIPLNVLTVEDKTTERIKTLIENEHTFPPNLDFYAEFDDFFNVVESEEDVEFLPDV